ncbi:N utilization substance protein B [Jannaschia pagri]|uniref:Transcription antitermination protein NusB n=1 Tax=Jannaschia pagri TaxID=2829797 RepID=A0ABQ4NIC4_9RHOB|nr:MULTISPECIES: transcription antitermination factor NusB [unclassified Jannaschia]GIT89728.1 N utilization substance protein B [Jannaschia sp. AI_61]GIT94164.1 N utilization substance protein B [Jannaschia sp. AI_62]
MAEMTRDEKRLLRQRMRSAARLNAVQALFQMEAADQGVDRVRAEFEDHRFGMETEIGALSEADVDTFRAILDAAVDHQVAVDQMTDRALVARWPLGRIDPTLRAVFRAAGAELMSSDVPPKVIITEYVEVARAFFPEGKEGGFVNGVLDHMAREARPGKL